MKKSVMKLVILIVVILFPLVSAADNLILEKDYNISMSSYTANSLTMVSNGVIREVSEAPDPPSIISSYKFHSGEEELYIIPKDVTYQSYVGGLAGGYVYLCKLVNMGFINPNNPPEVELSVKIYEESSEPETCTEDWVCTNWSSCANDQQTRNCTDSNNCGTIENKPSENQSCSAPTPDIECYSDEDCMIEGTGQPYCEGDKLCIPSMSYECKNDGTEESYCVYPEDLDCTACENGCSNAECISNPTPQPQKECEQIGIREDVKYCSQQFKLINQRADEMSCDNDFECVSNICLNGKCGQGKSSNLVYWIFGIIGLFILIWIIYFIVKRQ